MAPRLWKLPEWQAVWAARGKSGRSRRRPGGRATPPQADRPRRLAEAALSRAGAARVEGPRPRRARFCRLAGLQPQDPLARGPRAMQRLAMDLRMLSRELSHYLEHQVRVGFFGSGVGFSLILGFSVAYACYYLSSIAKVSRGMARAPWHRAAGSFAGSDNSRRSRRCRWQAKGEWPGPSGGPLSPASDGCPPRARDPADLGAGGAARSPLANPAELPLRCSLNIFQGDSRASTLAFT